MKTLALAVLLLIVFDVQAQITGGPKTAAVIGTTLTLTPLDTVAIYNRGKASVVCPPGMTAVDSIRIFRRGQNQKPVQVIFTTPDSNYILK